VDDGDGFSVTGQLEDESTLFYLADFLDAAGLEFADADSADVHESEEGFVARSRGFGRRIRLREPFHFI